LISAESEIESIEYAHLSFMTNYYSYLFMRREDEKEASYLDQIIQISVVFHWGFEECMRLPENIRKGVYAEALRLTKEK